MSRSGFAGEAFAAAGGLARLLRGDAAWPQRFDFTTSGFLRSFAAPLLALPLAVLGTALYLRATTGAAAPQAALMSTAAGQLIDAFGFPLLLALISGLLRFKAGYAAFVTVNNWAELYLNLMLTAAAPLALLGPGGASVFAFAALAMLCLSVVLVWRIARETLTHELAPIVLVVVLSVAWSTLADTLSHAMFGA